MDKPAAPDSFLARYNPEIVAQVQEVRAHLAGRFPQGFELVYDNYNALAFGCGLLLHWREQLKAEPIPSPKPWVDGPEVDGN